MEFSEILKELLMIVGIIGGFSIIYSVLLYFKLKSDNTKLNEAIEIVLDVVDKINQTYVDNLKKSGSFDEDAQKKALYDAVFESKILMNDSVQKFIDKNYGDIDTWIINKVESYINRQSDNLVSESLVDKKLNG